MKIPKEFQLGAITWSVVKTPHISRINGEFGNCDFNEQVISYTDVIEGKKVKPNMVLLTFYHEKIHAILDTMGRDELNTDEAFVDMFANLLLQSDLTTKY